ncbi:hypothetical protein J6590_000171 [Homalodisca vitripennis]|nr:hypothetical protein J6590_000171 [Homalodisca vitripennis]
MAELRGCVSDQGTGTVKCAGHRPGLAPASTLPLPLSPHFHLTLLHAQTLVLARRDDVVTVAVAMAVAVEVVANRAGPGLHLGREVNDRYCRVEEASLCLGLA